jgi:hypothetical protein
MHMEGRMKVYIITKGEYSDYHICGVFSTMKVAKKASDLYGGDVEIEEHKLDVIPDHPVDHLWYSVFMTKEGDTKNVSLSDSTASRKVEWQPAFELGVEFFMWAKDEKHAIKIANERRIQLIANNEWTTNWKTFVERNI